MLESLTTHSWADLVPIPQNDGGQDALACIAYPEDYRIGMEYLRALLHNDELSDRALDLTTDLIAINAAHYTTWAFRNRILLTIPSDLQQELEWTEELAATNSKNYQIWNHRERIVDRLQSPTREIPFTTSLLLEDSKNYHVWTYRQWVIRRFGLWDGELEFTSQLIESDVRNNSAWNHRHFVLFGPGLQLAPEVIVDEIGYVQHAIEKAPQNLSAWNYLRGQTGGDLDSLEEYCMGFAPGPMDDEQTTEIIDISKPAVSVHAMEMLADIYAARGELDRAIEYWKLLAEKFDSMRENYWRFRISSSKQEKSQV
ncbi:uncharacterized protein V1516DRAFT_695804 [Lipomyces oligophaga]|uniref:uncharacterized protein n=1 Tax=Lipomyces oligophaga TaxID=45792 RepID=UPI0034CD885D